jgi:hypothetical protein
MDDEIRWNDKGEDFGGKRGWLYDVWYESDVWCVDVQCVRLDRSHQSSSSEITTRLRLVVGTDGASAAVSGATEEW